MLTYEEMSYLAAFAETGTLSEVAEKFTISQPTITRAMKKAEAEFGVPLFDRTKNSIKFNGNGVLAAEEITRLLNQINEMLTRVRAYDRANRTISIGSGAAVKIPDLVRRLTAAHPTATVSSELKKPPELIRGLETNLYHLIILPYKIQNTEYEVCKIGEEHLMFLLPEKHKYAKRKFLTMAEMNGENMLLFSEIGFWADIVREKMPDSRFLIQNERYSFIELITNSILPCFVTDITNNEEIEKGRVVVPITDDEVNVNYYLVCKKENKARFRELFTNEA